MQTSNQRRVQLQINPSWKRQVDADRVRRAAVTALDTEGVAETAHCTVVIVGDEEMSRMHASYRDEEGPTDVLSFPFEAPALTVDDADREYLGDVVLCYPQAKRQADDEGHTPQDELDLLTVHGVLHLLGYDDETTQARREMWRRQADIMAELGIEEVAPRPR